MSVAEDQPGRARYEFKPEYEKFDAYFKFDYGTGRIRGLYLQGNEAARPIFRELLDPYTDLGASALSMADIGATDHIPFDEVGLPSNGYETTWRVKTRGPLTRTWTPTTTSSRTT